MEYESASAEERLRFHVLCAHQLTRFAAALEYEERGVVERGLFSRGLGRFVAGMFRNPGVQRFWVLEQNYFPVAMQRWVERREDPGPGTPLDFSGEGEVHPQPPA